MRRQIILASTNSSSDNESFRIIAGYIFGDNISKKKISMTAPVITSEKIPMTSPVITQKNKNKSKMSFIMPLKYSIKTLPKPNSNKIKIEMIIFPYKHNHINTRYKSPIIKSI